jgi:AcrR family transcriptional regulator
MSQTFEKREIEIVSRNKRERSKTANRDAILDSAARVFEQMGYEGATVRDIIRGTPLAAGTFYNYFKSKAEVFEALAEDRAQRFLPLLQTARAQSDSFEDYVRRSLQTYFDFLKEEYGDGDMPVGERRPHTRTDTPGMQAVYEEVRRGIEGAMERRLIPKADIDFLTSAFTGMAQEVAHIMLSRRPIDAETATQFALNFIMHGINQPLS